MKLSSDLERLLGMNVLTHMPYKCRKQSVGVLILSPLSRDSVRPEDGAWYQCTAQNAAGSTATRAKLYVDTGPAPPAGEPWRLQLPKPTRVSEPGALGVGSLSHGRHEGVRNQCLT